MKNIIEAEGNQNSQFEVNERTDIQNCASISTMNHLFNYQ